jgi:hypothetical protein
MFGGRRLRRVRLQQEQVDVVRDPEMDGGMLFWPPRPIEHQHNLLGRTGSCLAREPRELGQFDLKHGNTHGGREVEACASGGRMPEADEVAQMEPRKAVLHVARWQRAVGQLAPNPPQERPFLYLQVSCCSASASAWRRCGTC